MTDSNEKVGPVFRLVEWGGFAVLLLTAILVPLFILPVNSFMRFDTDRAESLMAKLTLQQGLCAAALVLAAVSLAGPLWQRYRGAAALPAALLAAFVAWGALSCIASPIPAHSYYHWLIVGLPAAVALAGPMFFGDRRRVRALVIALVAMAVVVALIGIFSALGWRGFWIWAYGVDPREMLTGAVSRKYEGGVTRSLSASTMGNAEYAGSLMAPMIAIAAVLLFDWAPGARRPWVARGALLAVIGILMLELALTGSRQPWIALALAGLLRLFLALRLPGWIMAVVFAGFLLGACFGGMLWGMAALAGLTLAALGCAAWRGDAARALRQADRVNCALVVGGPLIALVFLAAFSVPGPWNPSGLRVYQRFESIAKSNDASVRERLLMFVAASQMIREDPLLGGGAGRYSNRFSESIYEIVKTDESGAVFLARNELVGKIIDQCHNDYLQIATDMGLVALALFLSLLVAVLYHLARIAATEQGERRILALALICCFAGFGVMMLTSFPLQMPGRSSVFWVSMAGALGLIAERPRV